ncbi:MAG: O-antigen ligase family protein [Clostridia bacterium]|nr:O-antigen ligase family protein [Clostridia bacterium]
MSCFKFQTVFLAVLDGAMFIFIVKILLQRIKQKQNINFAYLLFGFFIICFIYSCIVNGNAYKISQSLGIVLTIIVLFLIKNISVKNVTLYVCFGLIISSILSLVGDASGIIYMTPFMILDASHFRFGAYFCNINALALYCCLGQTCLLSLFFNNKLNIKKWWWLLVTITLIGLSTFSKTFILITIFAYCLAILLGFIWSKNKKNYVKYALILLIGLILLILVFHDYIELIIERFHSNYNYSGVFNSITTGRWDIWKSYLNKWSYSPLYVLFGCGITAPNINDRTPHNFFVSLLYKFGIVGIVILVASLFYIFKQFKLHKNASLYLPLIVVLLNGLTEDLSCSLYTCLPLLVAFIFIINNKNLDVEK